MSFKSQVQQETSLAIREVEAGVKQMVEASSSLDLVNIEAGIRGGLANHSEPVMFQSVNRKVIVDIVSKVIAKGYGNLTPIQSLASSVSVEDLGIDRTQVALELIAGVATLAEYMRLVHVEGSWYVVSEYKHSGIDTAVYDAAHPLPSSINLKPLVDISSNAYRSESGYRVMLGSHFNNHDGELPLWLLNYLQSVPYGIENVTHGLRPAPKEKEGKTYSNMVRKQIAYNHKLHVQGTCRGVQALVDGGNQFYYAHSFDKRLRAFSKGHQTNLQGSEYDKSLVEFSNKQVLTGYGMRNLMIATANVFGMDKETFSKRLDWVDTNLDQLEAFTDQADEPLLFAKHVRALRLAQAGKETGIPVHFDATNSGAQIIGCLLGCKDSLLASNVIPNAEGKRMDLYGIIRKVLKQELRLDVSRKDVKKAVVPAFYGSEAEPKKIFGVNIDTFWKAMESFPGVYWYLKALPQLWRDDITEYSFTLPDGYKLHLPVTGVMESTVLVEILGEHINTSKEVIGRKEQSKCFLAHIVHSLDAYVLRNIVAKCKDHHIDIMCIHDSFGVHPNYVHLVMQWYREELSKLVLLNPLPKMIEEIFGHKIALPNYGTDRKELATQILQSEYALS